jgi:NADH:ubiquinone oxidoreductase subunit 5 (subunit L)/multisubunit Na+/H+ antiporter MnhA subunit
MADPTLLAPLIIIFIGALGAALFGLPALNRRLGITRLSWLLALAPLSALILLAARVPQANSGVVTVWQWTWLPSLGLNLGLYVDDLSLFFGLIITFIGTLIIVYSGQYFKEDQGAWRFLTYLLLFMVSMLGIVMAGDVLTLFIFWEGTSILSFLLVAYKTESETARHGAFRALLITGGGGIALLIGVLFLSYVAGGTDFVTILNSGDVLRSSEFYGVILALVALGAFSKSAQFPFHFWLPGAMSAPTPASAYLHSATMVKAGIYLLARLNPALGFTEAWFWLLTVTGGITMLAGAYLGLKQNDLKALLAYSTISQLGVLVMLIGQDIAIAYKALIIGILAHALYKSALFLVAGIVDHETGTRDMRRLGGLAKVMPFTFAAAFLAALSMAGVPPMFGFLAKETLLATAVHPTLPPIAAELIRWSAVVAGALMLAQAGLLLWETFLGKPKDPDVHGHEAPIPMWLAPAIPATLSIILAIIPGPKEEAALLSGAAQAAYGETVKVSFILFHGLTVELFLSIVAISLGTLLFIFRHQVRAWQGRMLPNLSLNAVYHWLLSNIDRSAAWATRLQQGKLRIYLMAMIAATILLVGGLAITQAPPLAQQFSILDFRLSSSLPLLRLSALVVIVGAAAATVVLKRDFSAILALGALGLAVALLYVLEPAPDVALVQIVVDILSLVILVLALIRLPRSQRHKAQVLTSDTGNESPSLILNAVIAGGLGLLVTAITLFALLNRPRESLVSPFYAATAKGGTGATDIVGAIVVDFRALDTLIEITVFSLAGLGIYTLLYHAARKHGDKTPAEDTQGRPSFLTLGIGGPHASPFIRVAAYVALPLSMILATTHIMYGHDQPGDGFTAGVIISLTVGLWYVVFGYKETRTRLPWLKASNFIGAGILLAIVTGVTAAFITGSILGNVDFTESWTFLPRGFHISTSFLIEIAICLTVLGSATHMLNSLGHPGEVER